MRSVTGRDCWFGPLNYQNRLLARPCFRKQSAFSFHSQLSERSSNDAQWIFQILKTVGLISNETLKGPKFDAKTGPEDLYWFLLFRGLEEQKSRALFDLRPNCCRETHFENEKHIKSSQWAFSLARNFWQSIEFDHTIVWLQQSNLIKITFFNQQQLAGMARL